MDFGGEDRDSASRVLGYPVGNWGKRNRNNVEIFPKFWNGKSERNVVEDLKQTFRLIKRTSNFNVIVILLFEAY
jgi:hypothetical protein